MKQEVFTVRSFAKDTIGGNEAGVVLNANHLKEDQMKKIALLLGYSETAFVSESDIADFKVRFFTPEYEVDLCGHATLAVFHILFSEKIISTGTFSQETQAGVLEVEVKQDGTIMMNQNRPQFLDILQKDEIARSLNIDPTEILSDLPIQIVSTGLRDIIIPIKNLKTLQRIKPNFSEIAAVSKKYDTIGYHLFSFDTLGNANAHTRNFAPLYGIPEESATGTSNGALSCYLFNYKKLEKKSVENIVIEQGYTMKKPSEIFIGLLCDETGITRVTVGGRAVLIEKRVLDV